MDIRTIQGKQLINLKIDCLTYSFPCQNISVQGKQEGLEKSAQSSLLWEIKRILKEINHSNPKSLPSVLVLENVAALTNKRHLPAFKKWINFLKKLNYYSEYQTLKASDYGSVTIRKRVIMISKLHLSPIFWPKSQTNQRKLQDILLTNSEAKKVKFLRLKKQSSFLFKETKSGLKKTLILPSATFKSESLLFHPQGLAPTLTASGALSRIKIFESKTQKIRYLLPLECFRLMDFDDLDFFHLEEAIQTKWFIFLAGNSIPVNLLTAVFQVNFKNWKK